MSISRPGAQPDSDGRRARVHEVFEDLRIDGDVQDRPWWLRFDGDVAATASVTVAVIAMLVTASAGIVIPARAVEDAGRASAELILLLVAVLAAVAVVAGGLALLSHARLGTGGHFRARAGIALAVGSAALLVLVVSTATPAERGQSGEIVRAGSVLLAELQEGDCLTEVPPSEYDDPLAAARAVPCAEPHDAVVAARVEGLPDIPFDAACLGQVGGGSDSALVPVAPAPALEASHGLTALLCLRLR